MASPETAPSSGSLRRRSAPLRSAALDLLFPPTCFACGQELAGDGLGACPDCRDDLPLLEGPACRRCGAPAVALGDERLAPCGHCKDSPFRFDEAVAAGVYEGLLRRLVLQAKRPAGDTAAVALGRLMRDRAAEQLRGFVPDVVTTVPMHWRRRLVRQTNSPELMAEPIADALGAPFAPRLLRRRRSTRPQARVAASGRLANVRKAFEVRRGHELSGAGVVLIDDILTTGATCSEAARALKSAGARRVVVIVAARSL